MQVVEPGSPDWILLSDIGMQAMSPETRHQGMAHRAGNPSQIDVNFTDSAVYAKSDQELFTSKCRL